MTKTKSVKVLDFSHPDNVDPNATVEGLNAEWENIEHSPSYYGFHCDGECYEQDNFPFYRKPKKNPINQATPQWHHIPAVLHPQQYFLNSIVLDHYRQGGRVARKGDGEYPAIIKWHGKYFIYDGTHRLAVAMERGDEEYFGRYYDYDNPENTNLERPPQ
jgi:hypothetical protein